MYRFHRIYFYRKKKRRYNPAKVRYGAETLKRRETHANGTQFLSTLHMI